MDLGYRMEFPTKCQKERKKNLTIPKIDSGANYLESWWFIPNWIYSSRDYSTICQEMS